IVAQGPAVALGYRGVGVPGEHRFVQPVPTACSRSFLTGDIGRFRADGALEVLGRKDDQLKVRGVRVDPLEVEAALRSHPSVREAAVAVHQRKGEGVLVAYVHCVGEPPSSAEFRRVLRARLSGPMVPSVYVQVSELPRTASGKLDRRALPSPFSADTGVAPTFAATAAPNADSITRAITEAWQQVLGVASVGLHDDFFEIGGSSLTGAQVVERLEHDFGIRLTLTTLLKHSTVAELGAALQSDDAKHRGFKLVRLRSGDGAPALLCIPGVRGRPAGVFALNERLSDARTVFAMDAEHADLDGLSVAQVATHYASVALATHPGPYCVVGYSFGGIFALETARALQTAGAQVTHLVLLDATVPRTAAVSGATRALVAVEEYLSLIALRVQRSLRDPFLYVRKLMNPAPWQEFRRSMRIASGDYVAMPLNVPTLFIRARSLPFALGRTRVWRALTGPFTTHSIWADHNGLLREPAVARVAAIVEELLGTRDS
ncbi:MAG TPA: phosphopantetheine-binding protein, partial [Gemmatimonadaceae bacterium]